MQEIGLAAQMGGAPMQPEPMRDVDQVVAMLKQGVSPDELVQRGIPVEVVQEAMSIIQQEMTQVPAEQAGLAGMMTERQERNI